MVLYAHTTEVPGVVWDTLDPLRLEFKLKSKEYMRLTRWKRGEEMYNTDKRIRYNGISRWMEEMDIFIGASFLVLLNMFQNTEHLGLRDLRKLVKCSLVFGSKCKMAWVTISFWTQEMSPSWILVSRRHRTLWPCYIFATTGFNCLI